MNNPAPIALFTYNRPLHTNMCVASLLKNPQAKDTDVCVFCDGWKNSRDREKVEETRRVARDIRGFKSVTVVEAKENRGLANSVIAGVTDVVNRFGRVIVVEDDLVFSPHFLEFMNSALELFENDYRVGNVHGHLFKMRGRRIDSNRIVRRQNKLFSPRQHRRMPFGAFEI